MKKIICFVLCFFVFHVSLHAIESYVVMDAESGRVLGSNDMNAKHLIASTTKIMTAIIAIENADLEQLVVVGDEVKKMYGSMIYIDVGEELTVKDLLYGLMLRSGNDAAIVLASNILGYDEFIKAMNRKAKDIGMYNTIFENPSGLDEDTQNYSTAYDMALLMRYAVNNEKFREITRTKKYSVKTNIESHLWYNKNKLLNIYKNATGGKIGYTTKSGHVFVSSAVDGQEKLIVVTIKDDDQFNNHKSFYERYFKDYDKYHILNKYTFSLSDVYYKNMHLYIKNDFYMMLKKSELHDVNLKVNLHKDRIQEGVVGYVEVKIKDKIFHKEPIYAISKGNKMKHVKNWLFFWKQ